MSDERANLIGGPRLARNVLWNLIGTGAPLLVALIVIPLLIEGLGVARFGVLTLAWMIVGYFSLFDFGLGRALTKLVAENLGAGRDEDVPALIWTAIALMAVLGLVGGLVAAALTPWVVGNILEIPSDLQPETRTSFYVLAASVPVVIVTTGLRGVLEARQLFGLVNLIRIPLGVLTFLGPAAMLPFSSSLVPVVTVLVLSRLAAAAAYGVLCLRVEPAVRHRVLMRRAAIRPLLGFGSWMTVSNVVSPLLVYMDRFLIGAMLSMTAVAYYATPYEVVTKLLVVPGALMGVMFPAFSTAFVQDRARADRLFERANNYVFIVLFPAVLMVVTMAAEGLTAWLGTDFATHSTTVLQLLAVGVLINGLAQVPFGMVQGAGRADLTAGLHVIELVLYLPILWWLLEAYGIVGAAIAWVARITIDALFLYILAGTLLTGRFRIGWRAPIIMAIALAALGLGALLSGLVLKCAFLLVALLSFSIAAWFNILEADERDAIRGRLGAMPLSG